DAARATVRARVWELIAARHGRIPPARMPTGDLGEQIVLRIDAHFIDVYCAPRSASLYPRRNREELGGRFLGLMAYPAPKGNTGTVACQESSGRAQAYEARRCGTRAIRLKQNCLNPNLQEMQVDIHRKDA